MNNARKLLQEIVGSDNGQLNIDYGIPKKKGFMSTTMRPTLYKRSRAIPGMDIKINQYFAYYRDGSSSEVLRLLKDVGSDEAVQFIKRTAIYMASKLKNMEAPFDAILPAPTSKNLVPILSKEIGLRLNVPVLNPPKKLGSMSKLHVSVRHSKAEEYFEVSDQPRLNGRILIIDDFTTSGATFSGIAVHLYRLKDVEYVAAAGVAVS